VPEVREDSPAGLARRVWPGVRALVITLVLVQQGVTAWPAQPMTEEQLTRPEGERFVSHVAHAFAVFGVERTRDDIKRALLDRSVEVARLRRKLLRPFLFLASGLSSDQQWGLFLVSRGQHFRMQIDLFRADGRWHTVYRAAELDELGLGPLLRYRRLRGLYNPSTRTGPRGQYVYFVSWLANELFARHGDAHKVRVQMERLELGYADEPLRSLGFEHARVRVRPEAH